MTLSNLRQDICEMVNDGEQHEMGGPFIDGNWLLKRIDEIIEPEALNTELLEALQAILWARSPDELDEAAEKAKLVVEASR